MNNELEFMRFLLDHWDKIILLLGVIGFFVRELYKLYLNKVEIKFSYYHNKLTSSIHEYMNGYFNYRKAMKNLPIQVFEGKIQGKELDNLTTDYLNELQRFDLVIRLYLDQNLYNKYRIITKESESLFNILYMLIPNSNLNIVEKSNKYDNAFREYDKKIEEILSTAFKYTRKEIK